MDLKPRWWNATQSVNLALNVVDTGSPSWLTEYVAAPIGTETYDPTTYAADATYPSSASLKPKALPGPNNRCDPDASSRSRGVHHDRPG